MLDNNKLLRSISSLHKQDFEQLELAIPKNLFRCAADGHSGVLTR